MDTFKKLKDLFSSREKLLFLSLISFSVFISIIETAGISAVMPFISIASDFKQLEINRYYKFAYDFLNFQTPSNFVIILGIALIVYYSLRGFLNILFMYISQRFTYGCYHHLSGQLYQTYLQLNYMDYVSKNSSILTKTIITEASLVTSVISNALFLLSETLLVVFLYSILLWVNLEITLILTVLLGLKLTILTKTISRWISSYGMRREKNLEKLYKLLAETFGNFKLIKLRSENNDLTLRFSNANFDFAKSYTLTQTLLAVPRFSLETIGFSILIGMVIYVVYKDNNPSLMLPVISMYALALYRLLPSFNRIVSSYNMIRFLERAIDNVSNDLALPAEILKNTPIVFEHNITFNNVSFGFDEKNILEDIDLKIEKGDKIAIIGESGGGKSTLIDLLIGLLMPRDGVIKVDGIPLTKERIKSWRGKIGYIPQQIYLFDGNIRDNVAFGREHDENRLFDALQKAEILDFLHTKQGLDTNVGENGIMLSGGQKQRIAIARAIYDSPEILVLDEATSALDSETEARIIDSIFNLSYNKTLIICAHRLSTIKNCNKIIHIENGRIRNEQTVQN